MTTVIAVVSAALGSAGLFSLTQFLIARRDEKTDLLARIERKLDRLEKDGCRTQLLLMISDYPDNRSEIMALAFHYFVDLKGNWYMSSLFEKWMRDQSLTVPHWYKK